MLANTPFLPARHPGRAGQKATRRYTWHVRCRSSTEVQAVHAQTQPYNILKLRSLSTYGDVQLLWKAAQLHSEAFHDPTTTLPALAPASSLLYALQSLTLQVLTYLTQRTNHLTILAFTGTNGPAATTSYTTSLLQERCIGTCNASLRIADDSFCSAIGCQPGTPFIIITNMTVTKPHRGQGLGKQLLQLALEQATQQFRPAAELLVLMVYQDNEAAVALYRGFGFGDSKWVDPRWLRDAERGRVGRPRRLLLVRRVGGIPPRRAAAPQ